MVHIIETFFPSSRDTLSRSTRNPDILSECVAASRHVMAREYYKALMSARKLVDYEEQLANVASGVQDRGDAG